MSSYTAGRLGEERARAYLEKKGCIIVAQNFRTRWGEVDIVCEAGCRVLFVEVKSWRRFDADSLIRALGPPKQRRIVAAARAFLMEHPDLSDRVVRFDVVLVEPCGGLIRHIEGAFDSEWPG
ncbi:MAG: YraN family protein [Spirochaetales bacterium]|nr:YraN family protein [Spirochaetales bacterium]